MGIYRIYSCNERRLTVCKEMSTDSLENVSYKLFVYKYIRYMIYEQDLGLNNLQGLICHKNTNQPTDRFHFIRW